MTPIFGLLFILLITFLGARFFSRSTIIRTPLFSGFIVSGIPYVLMGVLLGPQFFNFLNTAVISSLKPLISMALGWVGLLFGLQLRWRDLRKFPRNYLLFTSMQSLSTFFILVLGLGVFLWLFAPAFFRNKLEALLVLAALGSITAPLMISRIVIEHKARGSLTHFIQFVSSLDSFWGILFSGIIMLVFHPAVPGLLNGTGYFLFSILLGIAIGLLFYFLIHLHFSGKDLLLLVLGLVVFVSGVGFYLNISPIFLTMVVGITLAQFPRGADKVMRVLARMEKQTYLFLLIFAGASWNYRFLEEVLLILAFLLFRYLGKYFSGQLCRKKLPCRLNLPGDIGKALLSFGGVSLAIAFNFHLFYGGHTGNFVLSTTIVGLFVFDELAAVATLRLLRQAGEVT